MVVGGDVLGFERKICGCEKKTKRLQPYCFLNALRTQTACGHPVMVLFKSNKYAFIHPYLPGSSGPWMNARFGFEKITSDDRIMINTSSNSPRGCRPFLCFSVVLYTRQ